jgi:hypothetical protein
MALVAGSAVNIALPAIQHALHASVALAQWIVNAYLLLLLSATVALFPRPGTGKDHGLVRKADHGPSKLGQDAAR